MNGVIERSTQDYENEIKSLFESIKPLLDKGYTYPQALQKVKNCRTINTTNKWYKNVLAYGESKGYTADIYNRARRKT